VSSEEAEEAEAEETEEVEEAGGGAKETEWGAANGMEVLGLEEMDL
jgi:hypothetical protein